MSRRHCAIKLRKRGRRGAARGRFCFPTRASCTRYPQPVAPLIEVARPKVLAGQTMVDAGRSFCPMAATSSFDRGSIRGISTQFGPRFNLDHLIPIQRRIVMESRRQAAITSSGYLLFVRNGALFAQKLDVGRAQLVGQQLSIAEDVVDGNEGIEVEVSPGLRSAMGPAAFSVSTQGVLVYHSIGPQRGQLVWLDRQGNRLGSVGETREYTQLALSPDQRWAAVGIRNRERKGTFGPSLWLMQLDTHVLSRLSFDAAQAADPVWSPDSSRIVYGAYEAAKGENIDLMSMTYGRRSRPSFYADGHANKPEAWSPDGKVFLFRRDERFLFTLALIGRSQTGTVARHSVHAGTFQVLPRRPVACL